MRPKWPQGWAGDAGLLLVGTVGGQAIPLVLQPYLRRTFSAEEFGAFSVYFSLCSILSVSSSLRFEMAITGEQYRSDANRVHALSQWVNLAVSLGLFLLLPLAFVAPLGQWLGAALMPFLWTVPVAVLLMGSFRNLNMLLLREKLFRLSAWNKVNRRLAEGVVQLAGGSTGVPGTLILADVAGHAVNNASAYFRLRHLFRDVFSGRDALITTARKHKNLARLNALPSLLNTFCLMFPAIIIQQKFGANATGQYDLGRFVLAVPLALIGTSVGQVVLQRTGELRQQTTELRNFYQQATMVLAVLAVGIAVVVGLAAVPIFQFVFGDGWQVAATISVILAITYSLKLVVSPMSSALIALDRLRPVAYWQWAYTAFIVALFAWPAHDLMTFISIFAVGEAVLYVVYGLLIITNINKALRGATD